MQFPNGTILYGRSSLEDIKKQEYLIGRQAVKQSPAKSVACPSLRHCDARETNIALICSWMPPAGRWRPMYHSVKVACNGCWRFRPVAAWL